MLCNICPRKCNIDRKNKNGFCSVGEKIKISRAALHFYEEPCISGENGSGTVFFSGCNLKCVYCQNKKIAEGFGKEITINRLSEIFIELQEKGAHNINLVTPDHFAYKIIKAVKLAKQNGLRIPIVYNTSGYCSVETIKDLSKTVDIFLTDFKYLSTEIANDYSSAKDYPQVAKAALNQMFMQTKSPTFDENGIMQSGVIVRHLVLPENIEDSKNIIKYLYQTYGDKIIISIMNQFTPKYMCDYPQLNRKLSEKEYDEVVDFAWELGVENAYIQEGDTADESFIPDFDLLSGV